MLPQEIIRRKRDGATLSDGEIAFFVRGIADGSVGEGQVAAFAMAVFFRGMDRAERVALTQGLMRSGKVLDWSGENLPGPVLDKHSTGGVGDNVSLMLAPMVAACGGFVPMISGRGLGHTGGTLDKLESIPGYDVRPAPERFRRVVREVGCAIIGQTADLAPADGRLYGIRDVTATVESIPLITASILSKKLAAGLQGLVLDVKCGNGAFMATLEGARELAESLVAVANAAGLPTRALVTDMNQPLAPVAGNALEVAHAVDFLAGGHGKPANARVLEVTIELGAEMLVLGSLSPDRDAARDKLRVSLSSGAAAERFGRMVAALGGPKDFVERPDHYLPRAPLRRAAMRQGAVQGIDARALGLAVIELGGGRRNATDAIDHAVGLAELRAVGDGHDPLFTVHANGEPALAAALGRAEAAYGMGAPPPARPAVLERVG